MFYDDFFFRVGSDDFILVRYVKGRGLFYMSDDGFVLFDSVYRYDDARYIRCNVLRRLQWRGFFTLRWLDAKVYTYNDLKMKGRFFRDCYERIS